MYCTGQLYTITTDQCCSLHSVNNAAFLCFVQVCDQNNDGILNEEEYVAFLHPEEFVHTKDVYLQETFEDMDRDKDGTITLEEYIGMTVAPKKNCKNECLPFLDFTKNKLFQYFWQYYNNVICVCFSIASALHPYAHDYLSYRGYLAKT